MTMIYLFPCINYKDYVNNFTNIRIKDTKPHILANYLSTT